MALSWRKPPLTQAEEDELFMLTLEDDEEDSPWMVMGDLQFWSASHFAASLDAYARTHDLPWYVASMLPIRYRWHGSRRTRQLAPDCFVAFVPTHPRSSYNVEVEGSFPPFVLEVVSPASVERDEDDKLQAYDTLGAREYVLFTPRPDGPPTLAGYRRDETGAMAPWPIDAAGGLWSDVLGLRLIARENLLRAQTVDGEVLRTLQEAEDEVRRLRQELNRLQGD